MTDLTPEERKLIEGMAKNMGTTIDQLLTMYTDPKKLVESIKSGNYKILKEN